MDCELRNLFIGLTQDPGLEKNIMTSYHEKYSIQCFVFPDYG